MHQTLLSKKEMPMWIIFYSKKAKNDIELAKFIFIKQNKNSSYTPILVAEKLNSVEKFHYDLLETFYEGLNQNDKNSEKGKKLASFLKEYEQIRIGGKVQIFITRCE